MIILHPPFWKIVSGKQNRRALQFCFVDIVYQSAVVVRHNENVIGVFCLQRNWMGTHVKS